MPNRYLEDIATADVAFVAWGTSMEEMFGAAWDATLNVMVADPRRMENSVCREIKNQRCPKLYLKRPHKFFLNRLQLLPMKYL